MDSQKTNAAHSCNKCDAKLAVVLLSGGLDSATALGMALEQGFVCTAVSFSYSQRHSVETDAARHIARSMGVTDHRIVKLDPDTFKGSALTDDIAVPKDRLTSEMQAGIPVTYVPARNLVFLSIATAIAESLGARDVFIGVNEVDFSGYPDCRPAFIQAFAKAASLATKIGVQGDGFAIQAPLIGMSKAQIIQKGIELGVDFALTHSCYDPDASGLACGRCDSCQLRHRGFIEAGVADPTRYTPGFVS